jgi:1-deoxy-D-xylulose-5-phosphate reductoisomerase
LGAILLSLTFSPTRKPVALLGATGSIGSSILEIVRSTPDRYEVVALTAFKNESLLAALTSEFLVRNVSFPQPSDLLKSALRPQQGSVHSSLVALIDSLPSDTVIIVAIVGFDGVIPVCHALQRGFTVLLANKESIVAGGKFIRRALKEGGGKVLPLDSEHSAIFQLLEGQRQSDVRSLTITGSGGPFLTAPLAELSKVTPEQAVRHPRWSMGRKISVDSATMMNKGFEIIEARWFFPEFPVSAIIHPQSIVHALVELIDGTVIAHLSTPDMKGPLAYALEYPFGRIPEVMKPLDLTMGEGLSFHPLNRVRHRAIFLAQECCSEEQRSKDSLAGALFTVANDWAVEQFLKRSLPFDKIVSLVEASLQKWGTSKAESIEELLEVRLEVIDWLSKDIVV